MRLLIKSINSQLLPVFRQRITLNRTYSNLSIIKKPGAAAHRNINWLEVSSKTEGTFISNYKRITCMTVFREFSTKKPADDDPPL